ncbi:MAG: LytTR family DNA-binding domain-containing protein [Pseudomonadota bacterium]
MIVTIIGPFGTYGRVGELILLFYWAVVIFWSVFSSIFLSSLVRASMKSPSIPATIVSTLLFTITFAPFLIWFTDLALKPDLVARPSNVQLTVYVLVITIAIGVLVYQVETHFKTVKPQGPRLWRRLPQALQANIVRLSSDGHFVSIHTVKGSHRIRIRFADATAEMDGVEGGCVHRSHWVAKAHVIGVVNKANRPLLVMSDGVEVPVSRTYRCEAERMGLLPVEHKPDALATS